MDRADVDSRIRQLIEPFNKKQVAIEDATTFAGKSIWMPVPATK